MKTWEVHGCAEEEDGIERVPDGRAEFWSVYSLDSGRSEWVSDHLSRADAEFSANRAG